MLHGWSGFHAINGQQELIYIAENFDIKKLSNKMKMTTFIKRKYFWWLPKCVCFSSFSGDLLVGMFREDTKIGKVLRYNHTGELLQTIYNDTAGRKLFCGPFYITENNNGDIVVSDDVARAVVVTSRGGRHRFSYKGPSGKEILPFGICTDALSNILVCDDITNTIQIMDNDGVFLAYLPTKLSSPRSLCYDKDAHRLWIGSAAHSNSRESEKKPEKWQWEIFRISYKYIGMQYTQVNRMRIHPILKLISPPLLMRSNTVREVDCFSHISCVTSVRVWVNDAFHLILIDLRTGYTLNRVDDSLHSYFLGLHTVNSTSELTYIDEEFNIKSVSSDGKTKLFREREDAPWTPHCVYHSTITGDLLVGMCRYDRYIGKVNRYNKKGKITQSIGNENDNLYKFPRYITENVNRDVVVSDLKEHKGKIVVTDKSGRHRFSYTGPPSGSGLEPRGICTDVMSHILVCDAFTNTVQLLNSDGHFLSYLLTTRSPGMFKPRTLSFDLKGFFLLVGSESEANIRRISVYDYITRS